jgi:hypothetical protein
MWPYLLGACSSSSYSRGGGLGLANRWSPRGPSQVVNQPSCEDLDIIDQLYPGLDLWNGVVVGVKLLVAFVAMMFLQTR